MNVVKALAAPRLERRATIRGSSVIAAAALAFGLVLAAAGQEVAASPAPIAVAVPTIQSAGYAPTTAQGCQATVVLGRTAKGRIITACRRGPAGGTPFLVIGEIHGNEPAGRRVTKWLHSSAIPAGVTLWLITSVNPDGHAAKTRKNARRVDLNRNWPYHWKKSLPSSVYYSGRRAKSERETVLLARFVTKIRPRTVVVFHQALNVTDCSKREKAVPRLFASLSRTRFSCIKGSFRGVFTGWYTTNHHGVAFTYEFSRKNSSARIARVARAVLAVGASRRTWQLTHALFQPGLSATRLDESITLRNNMPTESLLSSVRLRTAGGQVVLLPPVRLAPGASVEIHTGTGINHDNHVYLGLARPLWANSDTVSVLTTSGWVLDQCRWSSTVGASVVC